MCDLVHAFKPLKEHFTYNEANEQSEYFKNNCYSYEVEHFTNLKKNSVGLTPIEPIKEKVKEKVDTTSNICSTVPVIDTPKPVREYDCILLSELFVGWNNRDLLVVIIMLQLILLLTIAIK